MFKLPGIIKQSIFGMLFLFSACSPSSQDADFKAFLKTFHQAKGTQFQLSATGVGLKGFDHPLSIPDRTTFEASLQFCKKYRQSLLRFDPEKLSTPLRFEYHKIEPLLSAYIRDHEQLKIHETDPTWYDLRDVFFPLASLENMPSVQQMEILENKLKSIPPIYAAAMENLEIPDHEKLQEAISQQVELYHFLSGQIPKLIDYSSFPADQTDHFEEQLLRAKLSIKDFIAFCQSKEFDYHDKALKAAASTPGKAGSEKVFTGKSAKEN